MDVAELWETMERAEAPPNDARPALTFSEPTLQALAAAHHAELDHRPDDAARALEGVDLRDPALARVAELLSLRIAVRRGDPQAAKTARMSALALAQAAPERERATSLRAHHLAAVASVRLGTLDDAEVSLGELVHDPLPVPFRYWVIDTFAQVLSGQGAWVEAARTMAALLRMRRDGGDAIGAAITAGNLARLHAELGRHDECWAVAREALIGLGERGSALTRLRLQTFVTMASASANVGDKGRREALDSLERAWRTAEGAHHYLRGYAALALSRAANAAGDGDAAGRWLEAARAEVSSPGQRLLVLHHEVLLDRTRLHDPLWRASFDALAAEAELVGEGEMRIRLALAEDAEGAARRAALESAYERAAQSNHPLWTLWLDELASRIDPELHASRLARRFSGWDREELKRTRREDVTIVFSDLVSFTARALELEPEAVMETVRGLFEIAVPVMTRHGVSPITYMGDGLLAVARGEGHERRGLAFARDFAARTTRISALRTHLGDRWRLDIRAGVASGPVVMGALGSFLKLDFAAIGWTTNLAARLQGAAAPGEVVCDERTAAASGITDAPFESIALKGFEKLGPIRACRLR